MCDFSGSVFLCEVTLTTALFPGQTTPSRKLPYGRYGSQQLSLESMQNSPGSSLMGGSCSLRGAHSLPLPKQPVPSPQGPRMAPRPQVVISSVFKLPSAAPSCHARAQECLKIRSLRLICNRSMLRAVSLADG